MDWIREHLTEMWLGLAILLGVAELFSLDLVLIMLAAGATGGLVTSLFTDLVLVQFLVAVAVSVGMLAVVRPELANRLHHGPALRLGSGKLIGHQAVVTTTLSSLAPGRIQLDGEEWTAEPYDGTLVIEPGETVEVLEIRGATAYVHPMPRLEP